MIGCANSVILKFFLDEQVYFRRSTVSRTVNSYVMACFVAGMTLARRMIFPWAYVHA